MGQSSNIEREAIDQWRSLTYDYYKNYAGTYGLGCTTEIMMEMQMKEVILMLTTILDSKCQMVQTTML